MPLRRLLPLAAAALIALAAPVSHAQTILFPPGGGGGGGGGGNCPGGSTGTLQINAGGNTCSGIGVGTGLQNDGTNLVVLYGTTAGTAAAGNDSRITGALQAANNLSDLASPSAARTSLGLGTAAVKAASGAGGTLASVTGSFVVGHLLTAADTAGTLQDGGTFTSQMATALGTTRGAIAEYGASGWTSIAPSSTVGQCLLSNGTGADPGYGTCTYTGTLPVANGGTASTTVAAAQSSLGFAVPFSFTANATVPTPAAGAAPTTVALIPSTASVTAPISLTLPPVSSYPSGRILWVLDESGTLTATNYLQLNTPGSDTITVGATTGLTSATITRGGGFVGLVSNGVHAWTVGPQFAKNSNLTDTGSVVLSAVPIDVSGTGLWSELPNDTSTGTVVSELAKITSAGKLVKAATTDSGTVTPLFLVTGNAGTSGNAQYLVSGIGSGLFDGTTVIGNWVTASPTVAGELHDTGTADTSSKPQGAVGIAVTGGTGVGTYSVLWVPPGSGGGGGGGGTVTSVGLTGISSFITVSGSPVTSSGTFGLALASQTANLAFMSPNGSAGAPGFRAIVGADLPNPGPSSLGGVQSYAGVAHQWISSISTAGVPASTQPSFSDLAGAIVAGQQNKATATTLGAVIVPTSPASGAALTIDGSGNLSAPLASATVLGVVKSDGGASTSISGAGVISAVSPFTPYGGYQSGRSYGMPADLGTNGTSATANTALAAPWVALSPGTIQDVIVDLTTATTSASNVVVSILAADGANGQPGTVLATSVNQAWGIGTTGTTTIPITLAVTTNEKLYIVFYTDATSGGKFATPTNSGGFATANVISDLLLGVTGAGGFANGVTGQGFYATGTFPTIPTSGWTRPVSNNAPPAFRVEF